VDRRISGNPDVDFVYSGYEFVNNQGGVAGEMFDPYLLQCSNYIATMFPMARDRFPGFDESVESGAGLGFVVNHRRKGRQGTLD
jgi:hypothetical protein